jgi:hypothetical protein
MELNNKCYLFVSDANGVVIWESMFDSDYQQKYIVGTFTGMSPDPSEWPVNLTIYAHMHTTNPILNSRTPNPTYHRPSSLETHLGTGLVPTDHSTSNVPTNKTK